MIDLHRTLIEREATVHLSCAGAGPALIHKLWRSPGASSYLVGVTAPYGRGQLAGHIGYTVEGSFCSKDVAIDLAIKSYVSSTEHLVNEEIEGRPIGIGVTAAVASSRLPRGDQRAHIVVISEGAVLYRELKFKKSVGLRNRWHHDSEIAEVVATMVSEGLCESHSEVDISSEALDRLLELPSFEVDGSRRCATSSGLYLPASLNPLHEGHREMARLAELAAGGSMSARYLVSTSPIHKSRPPLQDLLAKVGAVSAERHGGTLRAIEFSKDDPLFVDKAAQRPSSTFVIGADVMRNILDPKWGIDPTEVLRRFRKYEACFFVLGRKVGDRFIECSDTPLPSGFEDMFVPLDGRIDISSTELRNEKLSVRK